MDLLKRRYGTRRVHCNIVYNEFIAVRPLPSVVV